MSIFGCVHEWKVLDKSVIRSPFAAMMDALRASGRAVDSLNGWGPDGCMERASLTVTCNKCGAIKHYVD